LSVQKKRSSVNWSGFAFFAVCVAFVEVFARLGWLTSYVPPPSQIFVALWQGMLSGDISSQIGITLWVYVQGLALATIVSICIGILMGTYKPVFDALKVIVEFLRPVPSVAMIPLAILFFGLGPTMRISVITYAAFWPMLINTIYGVRAIDPQALDVARNFGITGYEALWRVTLPSALASIATGFRVSISRKWNKRTACRRCTRRSSSPAFSGICSTRYILRSSIASCSGRRPRGNG
jgi:ABC-type nitrate/sulfonate/bicarbonate transport system permease component